MPLESPTWCTSPTNVFPEEASKILASGPESSRWVTLLMPVVTYLLRTITLQL